jgi:recombination associated protein RdgC
MLIKNAIVYRLTDEPVDLDALEQGMKNKPFVACTGLDWFTQGFVPAAAHQPDLMLFRQQGCAMIMIKREDKVLPAKVINAKVDEKIADIEARENRKVGRKEKTSLKEQITDDLLPRAFTKHEFTQAYIDTRNRWFVVNASSEKKAEELLSMIREIMPSFPARLIHTQMAPYAVMTSWLRAGEADGGFELDSACELLSPDVGGAVIKASRQDLTADEIREHLNVGKECVKLGLIWNSRIRFSLTDKMHLKGIEFLDILKEEVAQSAEDSIALFEGNFTMTTQELAKLFDALLLALGGEKGEE